MTDEQEAVLSIGANLGDRAALIDAAIGMLAATDGIRVAARSSLWESAAWKPYGAGDAPDYLNVVVIVRTALEPLRLLDAAHVVEDALGRVRRERYGDRTIDVDVVAIGDLRSDDPRLTLPHPRAHERRFVLLPWLEVQPEAVLPGRGPIDALAAAAPGEARPVPDEAA